MRCMIVDDHPLTRDGTALALRREEPDMEVFEAASLREAFGILATVDRMSLVLLDLDLGDSEGLATLTRFKSWCEEHEVEVWFEVFGQDRLRRGNTHVSIMAADD